MPAETNVHDNNVISHKDHQQQQTINTNLNKKKTQEKVNFFYRNKKKKIRVFVVVVVLLHHIRVVYGIRCFFLFFICSKITQENKTQKKTNRQTI